MRLDLDPDQVVASGVLMYGTTTITDDLSEDLKHWEHLSTEPQSMILTEVDPGEKMAHKHKLFGLVNVQMALGQTGGCPRVNRAKKFMCSPRNTGNINFSLWLTGGLSQGCPNFQKVYVFKVYVPFSCPSRGSNCTIMSFWYDPCT